MSQQEAQTFANDLPQWQLSDKHIERVYTFEGFRDAIAFVNRVADAAEQEDHHPDIHIDYNRVKLVLWTKKIGGLSRNDFILAAKCDSLAS